MLRKKKKRNCLRHELSYLITASHGENWGKWEEEGMIKEQRAEHAVWLVKQGGTADKHAWTHETGHLDMEPFKHLTVQTHTHTTGYALTNTLLWYTPGFSSYFKMKLLQKTLNLNVVFFKVHQLKKNNIMHRTIPL